MFFRAGEEGVGNLGDEPLESSFFKEEGYEEAVNTPLDQSHARKMCSDAPNPPSFRDHKPEGFGDEKSDLSIFKASRVDTMASKAPSVHHVQGFLSLVAKKSKYVEILPKTKFEDSETNQALTERIHDRSKQHWQQELTQRSNLSLKNQEFQNLTNKPEQQFQANFKTTDDRLCSRAANEETGRVERLSNLSKYLKFKNVVKSPFGFNNLTHRQKTRRFESAFIFKSIEELENLENIKKMVGEEKEQIFQNLNLTTKTGRLPALAQDLEDHELVQMESGDAFSLKTSENKRTKKLTKLGDLKSRVDRIDSVSRRRRRGVRDTSAKPRRKVASVSVGLRAMKTRRHPSRRKNSKKLDVVRSGATFAAIQSSGTSQYSSNLFSNQLPLKISEKRDFGFQAKNQPSAVSGLNYLDFLDVEDKRVAITPVKARPDSQNLSSCENSRKKQKFKFVDFMNQSRRKLTPESSMKLRGDKENKFDGQLRPKKARNPLMETISKKSKKSQKRSRLRVGEENASFNAADHRSISQLSKISSSKNRVIYMPQNSLRKSSRKRIGSRREALNRNPSHLRSKIRDLSEEIKMINLANFTTKTELLAYKAYRETQKKQIRRLSSQYNRLLTQHTQNKKLLENLYKSQTKASRRQRMAKGDLQRHHPTEFAENLKMKEKLKNLKIFYKKKLKSELSKMGIFTRNHVISETKNLDDLYGNNTKVIKRELRAYIKLLKSGMKSLRELG